MTALISAFEYISQNAIVEEVKVYSDSLGAGNHLLFDTKQRLRIACGYTMRRYAEGEFQVGIHSR